MLLSSGHLKSTFDFSWSVWDIIWASESASGPMHFYQSVWEIWERLRNVWWQKNNSLKKNPFIGGTWSGWARMGQSRPLDFWLNHMGSFGTEIDCDPWCFHTYGIWWGGCFGPPSISDRCWCVTQSWLDFFPPNEVASNIIAHTLTIHYRSTFNCSQLNKWLECTTQSAMHIVLLIQK